MKIYGSRYRVLLGHNVLVGKSFGCVGFDIECKIFSILADIGGH